MAYVKAHFFLRLLLLLGLLSVSFSDDTAVMSKLLAAFSPPPSGWSTTKDFCSWTNVNCDKSTGNVVSINLDSQSISGELPLELTELGSLQKLSVQKNSLSGTLPSFANMSKLEELYLDSNGFTSTPPDFLLGVPSLRIFSVSDNGNLSPWKIPDYLTESAHLGAFYASNSSIFGAIPNFFDSFPNLQNLGLRYNNLTGSLPGSFGSSEIQNLWLNNQKQGLSGGINVLSSMTQLSQVWLHANAFTGPIPDLSKCVNLFDLHLRDNQFTGILPVSITGLPNLVNITLQNNELQGPIPQFGKNVKAEFDKNSFCKDSPGPCDPQVSSLLDFAGGLGYPITLAQSWQGNDASNEWSFITCDIQKKNVITVNLGKQRFSGTISPALANLTSLRNLYLNDNNLTGPIPEILTTLPNLEALELSNNNLSGPIPVFPHPIKFSHGGNLFLGKNVTTGGGSGSGQNSDAPSDNPSSGKSNGSSISGGMIVGVVIGVVIFVLVVLFVSYKFYMKRQHKSPEKINKVSEMGTIVSIEIKNRDIIDCGKTFLAQEDGSFSIPIQLLEKATNFFSQDNVLGSGGYGVVYLGKLDDGTKVAVKKMKDGVRRTEEMKEFQAEIAFLAKVRHINLVAMVGYCMNNSHRLLVYEYMSKGTLGHHLFEWEKHGFDPLTWRQRVRIALDVGRGIEYLHSLAHQSFIHRDIKSSNILLSDEMRAKVADFGLVRIAPDTKSSVETRVAGTFGYLAPEYATTGRATTKVDVYAFGVVLMEIITGKKAVDETCHLVTWFSKVIRKCNNLRNAIDPTLDPDEHTFESISKVAELAVHCTSNKYFRRPNMEHVVNVLGPYAQKWKPLRPEEIEEKYGGLDLHMSLPLVFEDSFNESLSFTAQFNGHRLNHSSQF